MIHLCLAFVLAMQSPSAEVIQHIQAGLSADKQGDHAVAIEEFKKGIELAPDVAASYVDLGTVYMEENRCADAIPQLQKAISLQPDIAGAQAMLGYALLFQGYASQAIPHFRAGDVKVGLGIAQLENGDLTAAIENLGAALQQQPDNPDILYYLSRAAGLLSKQTGDRLLATQPNSARAHQALAENYWAFHRAPDAEKEYETALRIRPHLPGVHLELGELYANIQQWPKAEVEFQAAATLSPGSAEAAYRYGEALLENGKIHEAVATLTRADELEPNMPETLYALGHAEALAGNPSAGEKYWNHQLEIEKDSELAAKAHFGLATIYRKQNRPAEAVREMKAFQQLKGQNR
jgi:tetratricopeptide (TPR) repeat protein